MAEKQARSRKALNTMAKSISDMIAGGAGCCFLGYKLAYQVGSDGGWPVKIYDESLWFFTVHRVHRKCDFSIAVKDIRVCGLNKYGNQVSVCRSSGD